MTDDDLNSGFGNDIVRGGKGNDWLLGEGGADRFVFASGRDKDSIFGFENGVDKIDFDIAGLSFANLTITACGANTEISIQGYDYPPSGPANTITLYGVTASQVDASDFIF